MFPAPPQSALFPYTTLFRSYGIARQRRHRHEVRVAPPVDANRRVIRSDARALGDVGIRAGNASCRYEVVGDDGESRSEEHTSELQSQSNLVCRLLLEKKKIN